MSRKVEVAVNDNFSRVMENDHKRRQIEMKCIFDSLSCVMYSSLVEELSEKRDIGCLVVVVTHLTSDYD
jgi:ribosomal protein S24E